MNVLEMRENVDREKIEQLVKILISLSRKTCNEGAANSELRAYISPCLYARQIIL